MTASQRSVQRLAASCLEDADRFAREVVNRACRDHPSEASELRRRYEALRAAGLVAGATGFVAEPDSWSSETKEKLVDPEIAKRFPAIAHYQPLRELGRGGQAVVYLAEDRRLDRPVALKVLRGIGPLTETMIRRFRREAEVASRLDHPGICAVFDAGVDKDVPFIAMRFIDGATLADRIAKAKESRGDGDDLQSVGSQPRLGVQDVLELIEKVARALHVAHEAGIVHRDVKPGNIMITPPGEPVLLDFGLAGGEDGDLMSLTGTGDSLGTPAYMSPEQLQGRRIRVDRRTDVYSLGVTLFECLALERPYRAGTREAVYEAIQFQNPTNILELNPALSKDLKIIVETALEKDRDRRYRTAEALADDLARVRRGEPVSARPISAPGRAWRWAKRRPVRAALVSALVLGIPILATLIGAVIAGRPAVLEARREAHLARVDAHLESGLERLDRRDFAAAAESFQAALDLQPDSLEAVGGKALALLRGGRLDDCLSFLIATERAVAPDPALREIRLAALRGLGRDGEATDLEKKPQGPGSGAVHHFLLGLINLTEIDSNPTSHPDSRPLGPYHKAQRHFLTAGLAAPTARKLYHLGLYDAAVRLGDPEARKLARFTMRVAWGETRE